MAGRVTNTEVPDVVERVMTNIATKAPSGRYKPGRDYTKFSEEWYWDMLMAKVPFRSIFEDTPNSRQPLISTVSRNLIQTPREQCELLDIVKEGLDREGPGQEVELHGLQGRPELNGCRGRVLPRSGRGVPPDPPAPGRVAVRLLAASSSGEHALQVLSVKPTNLRSVLAAAGAASTAGGQSTSSTSGDAASRGDQDKAQRRARILQLFEDEFKLWHTAACVTPVSLRGAGMNESLIRCGQCERGGQQVQRFVGLKRGGELRAQPLPHELVQLRCLDCFAELAERLGMPLTAKGAEDFCEKYMMGGMEVCWNIQGLPFAEWGGPALGGSGQLY